MKCRWWVVIITTSVTVGELLDFYLTVSLHVSLWQQLVPFTYPVVMVTVGAPWTWKPFPSIWFCLQLLLGRCKTSTLSTQRYYSPNSSFVGPFFSLLALFLAKLSWQALPILIHAQTTFTCVSLPWLRYYHRAQRLAWYLSFLTASLVMWSLYEMPNSFLKHLISAASIFFRISAVNAQVSQAYNNT